jgi:enamine deaminase RidA (YjgF/YER057c/UK114 family)
VTDEWEVRLTLAVEPPPDEGTVHRMGTTAPVPWSGVGLAEGNQGITRLALNFVSSPTTPAEAVVQAFDQVDQSLDRHGLDLERVIDVAVVSATRDERDW